MWNNKGTALNKLGKHTEAIECFDKVLEIDPKYVEAWNNKGISLYKLGKYYEAQKCLNRASKLIFRKIKKKRF